MEQFGMRKGGRPLRQKMCMHARSLRGFPGPTHVGAHVGNVNADDTWKTDKARTCSGLLFCVAPYTEVASLRALSVSNYRRIID